MQSIKVSCFTNLDQYSMEEWPREMACRPVVGDWVVAKSGKRLVIVSIDHCFNFNDSHGHPYLRVELYRKEF